MRQFFLYSLVYLVILLIFSPLGEGNAGLIDVTKFGAVGDGDPKKAIRNTEAIKRAWNQAAKEDGSGGTLYFPAGTYVINRIGAIIDGFAPLKYTNIKGDGQVKSILKLAPGQNSQLLRIPDRFFDATISDIGFNGNADKNPDTDVLVYIRGYNISIRDVWIAHSGGDGLNIGNQQQIRIEQIDVEHNKGWGIVSENNMSITFDSISSEYNKLGGLLILAEAAKGKRATAPAIIASGLYFESEPLGLELRGVSGVEVHAVSAHSVPVAVKISNDASTGLGATGNIIYVQGSTGDIEIEAGNYGNSVIVGPYTKYMLKVKDRDGRNYSGPLVNAPSELMAADTSEMTSVLTKKDMTSWQTKNGKNSNWKAAKKKVAMADSAESCTLLSSYYELTTIGEEQSSISYTSESPLSPRSDYYIETFLSIYGSCKVELEVYDTINKEYYNWMKESWTKPEKLAAVIPTTRMPVLTNGTFQKHQFTLMTDNKDRQPRLTYFVEGCFGRKARFYCTDIKR